jgi:hypothetical protein
MGIFWLVLAIAYPTITAIALFANACCIVEDRNIWRRHMRGAKIDGSMQGYHERGALQSARSVVNLLVWRKRIAVFPFWVLYRLGLMIMRGGKWLVDKQNGYAKHRSDRQIEDQIIREQAMS